MGRILYLDHSFETFERPGLVIPYKCARTKIFKGSMVGLNDQGYAGPLGENFSQFIGVANETVNPVDCADGDKRLNVTNCGSFVFESNDDVQSQSSIGRNAYAMSEASVTSDEYGIPVGVIVGIEQTALGTSGYRIKIDSESIKSRATPIKTTIVGDKQSNPYKEALANIVAQASISKLIDETGRSFTTTHAFIDAQKLLEVK